MALSGSLSNAFRTGYRIQIDWSATQDVASNTSLVTANFYLISTGSSYSITSSAAKTLTITIDGTTFTHSVNVSIAGGQTKWLASSSKTIAHNADGTRDFAISGALGINVTLSGTYWGTVSIGAVAFSLNTIPRATTPTLSAASVNMGTPVTIYTNRASSAFTHTLVYTFEGVSDTIATGVATSYAWTIPLALANYLPNASSGVLTVMCYTYNGGTLIGTSAVALTAIVPSTIVPTISAVSIAEAVAGLATKFSGYVQNKSKLSVGITAAGAYSSSIKTYTTTILGINYSGAAITSEVLTSSGTVPVVVTATDSRGRTATVTNNVSVVAYANPSIAAFTVQRCNASGVINDEGTSLSVTINFTVSAVGNKNDKSYKLEYKKTGTETWTTLTTGNVYSYNSVYTNLNGLFSPDFTYSVRLTVTDFFGSSTATAEIPTAFTLIDFSASGKGLAIGQVSSADGLVCAMQATFKSPVSGLGLLDFVHPVGSIFETTSPNFSTVAKVQAYFGGSWEIFGAGRVLVGVDSTQAEFSLIEGYAGEKTHTLTTYEIPQHVHYMYAGGAGGVSYPGWTAIATAGVNSDVGPSGNGYLTGYQGNLDCGHSHNNLQPYINIYRYRRIA